MKDEYEDKSGVGVLVVTVAVLLGFYLTFVIHHYVTNAVSVVEDYIDNKNFNYNK